MNSCQIYCQISLRLLLPVTKSFANNEIALYSSCVCSSLAAMLRNFFTQFCLKVRGIIPPEFKTEGIDSPIPPAPTPMLIMHYKDIGSVLLYVDAVEVVN